MNARSHPSSILYRLGLACLVPLLVFSSTSCIARAQTGRVPEGSSGVAPSVPALAYDVAVIRPSHAENLNSGISVNDTTLRAENVSVPQLLQFACDIRKRQISGLPSWAEHQRFDISAKILDASPEQIKHLTSEQTRRLLRQLLEQRFGLKWHNATEVVSAYELVVSKGGAKLTPTQQEVDDDSTNINNTDMVAKGVSMKGLADTLSDQVDHPVVDKTGLAGRYDMHLKWSREEARAEAANNGSDADAPPPIFVALEEQLGLRLVPGKDEVRELVVDQLTPPTEN